MKTQTSRFFPFLSQLFKAHLAFPALLAIPTDIAATSREWQLQNDAQRILGGRITMMRMTAFSTSKYGDDLEVKKALDRSAGLARSLKNANLGYSLPEPPRAAELSNLAAF
jgi:hypothetical protein